MSVTFDILEVALWLERWSSTGLNESARHELQKKVDRLREIAQKSDQSK